MPLPVASHVPTLGHTKDELAFPYMQLMSQKNYQQKTSLESEAVCSEPHSDLAKQLFPELQQSHLSLPACFRRIQPRDITLPLQRAGN